MLDAIQLSQKLIQISSYSGVSHEVVEFLKNHLTNLNFVCDILEFDGDESYSVNNLHAIFNPNNSAKTLYFAGHTDVVAAGDIKAWAHHPFSGKIVDGKIFGRGASDMKCALACFISAVSKFLETRKNLNFGIGFLITNDEEADGINGTKKVLEWMKTAEKPISACVVGEPTNPEKFGEMIKIGRRGSINFSLKITGKQGHIAYPHNALNPITILVNLLKILKDHKLDEGSEFFDASNLEITSVSSDNFGYNVIPQSASANFNVRFNDLHSSASIIEIVKYVCDKAGSGLGATCELTYKTSGESFLSEPKNLAKIVSYSVEKICGKKPVLSTSGGTSDARFIKHYCDEVVEIGLVNKTAHKIDEFAYLEDVKSLEAAYLEILERFSSFAL
jgi:succinyl-diaminopimelate desuccinylase